MTIQCCIICNNGIYDVWPVKKDYRNEEGTWMNNQKNLNIMPLGVTKNQITILDCVLTQT